MLADLHPQYLVDESGQRQSVVLPLAEFEALLAQLDDDYETDVAALESAAESVSEFKPWRQMRDEIEARHKP
jgi:hypothetical protein